MKSPRWQHRTFLTSLPLTRKVTIIHEQDSTETVLEHRGEAEALLCTQRLRRTALEGEEKQLHTDLTAPSPGWHNTMRRGLSSLHFLQWEKRAQGDNQLPWCCGSFCGNPYSGLISWGLQANQWDLTTGNLTVMEKRGRASNNQQMDLGRARYYLECPSRYFNQWLCSIAEPTCWCILIRELSKLWYRSAS